MEVLRMGDKELAQKKRERRYRFLCEDCMCVFIAKEGEYKWGTQREPGPYSTCPCCGKEYIEATGKDL